MVGVPIFAPPPLTNLLMGTIRNALAPPPAGASPQSMPPSHAPSDLGSSTPVSLLRLAEDGLHAAGDAVATEEPLEIQVSFSRSGVRVVRTVSLTMCTPGDEADLAAGFLFTEGIVGRADDIVAIGEPAHRAAGSVCGRTIQVTLRDGVEVALRSLDRHFYTTSSCGVCGKTSIEALLAGGAATRAADCPRFDLGTITRMPRTLRDAQAVFEQTGGLHAAGLFSAGGDLLCLREDVGRHNAVDKVLGSQFARGALPADGRVLVVSGRASFELMQKAIMAGVPVLAAVGAPSSLAVEVARHFGTTLLGFVREGRVNVYAGADRLGGPEFSPP